MKLKVQNGVVVEEIPPYPYKPDWQDWIRKTALVRYFYYRQGVSSDTLRFFQKKSTHYEANIDVNAIQDIQSDIKVVMDYLFGRLKTVAAVNNTHLLLLMDGVRDSIYTRSSSDAFALNKIAAETAKRHNISFVDLHSYFIADWEQHHMRFEFLSDNHWNEHGHQIAAKAIKDYIRHYLE